MKDVLLLNKPVGLTPHQAVELFKEQNDNYKNSKISYAGRLDPMAEGLLLLLVDEENKKRKQYEELEKTYEFSALLGVSTDSYDLMGKIEKIDFAFSTDAVLKKLQTVLNYFQGEISLPYPPYSSKTVNGIPLYKYARENRLKEIALPQRSVTIASFEPLSSSLFSSSELLSYISRIIPQVRGDFRQDEIVKQWHDSSSLFPTQIPKVKFCITCSSGTYVRSIVHTLGEKLGVPTVTYTIKRTRINDYTLEDAIKLKKLPVVRG